MNIITGYKGEPHITSLQDRAANQGSYGTGSYVLDVGSKMTASVASANEIHINDGVLSHQGCVAIIEPGTYDAVEINNGQQGMNRIDRIVARYTKNSETNIENLELVVIEGTPSASTPSAPSYSTGDIQNGALQVDMPLYNVRLSGITIASVDKQFSAVRTQAEIDTLIGSTSISGIGGGTLTGAVSTLNENVMSSSAGVITSTMASGTVRDAYVVKSGRNLNILFFVTDTSVPATGNIATLPEGYRPQGARYLMGEVIVNDSRIPMRFNVDMNGNIAISYGNVTMTQVEIAGTIPV